jgi:uncharacterized phage protein (TIGR02218 family)
MANTRTPQNWQSPSDATSLITYHAKTAIESLCTCAYMVSAIGGDIVAVTDWSDDLTSVPGYPSITFKSTGGISLAKLEHPDGTDPSNTEADIFISASGLNEADIQAGKWDHGICRIFTTNALALHMGQFVKVDGFFSEFTKIGRIYRVELRGKIDAFSQTIGKVTAPLCDAVHGDARCGRDLVALGEVHTVTLTTVTDQKTFRASSLTQGATYFDNAEGIFNDGDNEDFPFQVDSWNPTTKEFKLRIEMPYLPQVGNSITVKRGCKLRSSDCIERANAINFRGFGEDIPTLEDFNRLPTV